MHSKARPPHTQAAPTGHPKYSHGIGPPRDALSRMGIGEGSFVRAADMPCSGLRSSQLQTVPPPSVSTGYFREKYKKQDQCGTFSTVRPAVSLAFLLLPHLQESQYKELLDRTADTCKPDGMCLAGTSCSVRWVSPTPTCQSLSSLGRYHV